MGKRSKPADPEQVRQAALLKAARERHAERLRDRDPGEWGVSAEIVVLPTGAGVDAVIGARGRIIRAHRSDAFHALFRAGSLSDDQHRAAERYLGDWMQRFGVGGGSDPARTRVDEADDGQGRMRRMIDAGGRIDAVHARLGRASRLLLQALVEPMTLGQVRVWRAIVQQAAGVSERHAQGAVVVFACEDLRLAYDEIDGVTRSGEARRGPISVWRPAR